MNTRITRTAPLVLLASGCMLIGAFRPVAAAEPRAGGYSDAATTNAQVIAAAEFAVKVLAATPERTVAISLVEVLTAQQQVVAGMNYRLRIKVKVDGTDKEVEVVVWRKLSGEHNLKSSTWK